MVRSAAIDLNRLPYNHRGVDMRLPSMLDSCFRGDNACYYEPLSVEAAREMAENPKFWADVATNALGAVIAGLILAIFFGPPGGAAGCKVALALLLKHQVV